MVNPPPPPSQNKNSNNKTTTKKHNNNKTNMQTRELWNTLNPSTLRMAHWQQGLRQQCVLTTWWQHLPSWRPLDNSVFWQHLAILIGLTGMCCKCAWPSNVGAVTCSEVAFCLSVKHCLGKSWLVDCTASESLTLYRRELNCGLHCQWINVEARVEHGAALSVNHCIGKSWTCGLHCQWVIVDGRVELVDCTASESL